MHRCYLCSMRRILISWNEWCTELKDNVDLIWKSKIIALLSGLIIKVFDIFISSKNKTNECYLSCSSSHAVLITLKDIIYEIVSKSFVLNAFKGGCKCFNSDVLSRFIKPLTNEIFNATANYFTILLNRRDAVKKLSLKMAKEIKRKNRHVSCMKFMDGDMDAST